MLRTAGFGVIHEFVQSHLVGDHKTHLTFSENQWLHI